MRNVMTFIVVVAASTTFSADRNVERPKITTYEIAGADVLGSLGQPLGKCFRIKATIELGDHNLKSEDGVYFLKVTEVENKKLETTVRTRFVVPHLPLPRVKIADNHFRLYEIRMGKKSGSLSSDQIKQLHKDYIGTSVNLVVYETGSFEGIPENLPMPFPVWQGTPFMFHTTMIVVDQES